MHAQGPMRLVLLLLLFSRLEADEVVMATVVLIDPIAVRSYLRQEGMLLAVADGDLCWKSALNYLGISTSCLLPAVLLLRRMIVGLLGRLVLTLLK